MMKNKFYLILVLSYLFIGINTQAATTGDQDCNLKSIEETILDVEGGCRCAYTNISGQKLIGVGYNLNTQRQQQNLQQMLSLDSDSLNNIVSGNQPLTTDQILQLLTSSADVAVSDLQTIFTNYQTTPAIVQMALVRIYYDLTLSGLKLLTGFIDQIQAKNYDQAAVLLQYTDTSKSKQTSYCQQQTTSCTLNAKLIGECYDEELTAAQAQNTNVSTVPPTPDNASLKNLLISALQASTCNYVGSCTLPKSGGLGGGLGKSKNQQTIQPTQQSQDKTDQSASNSSSGASTSQNSQQSTDKDDQTTSTDKDAQTTSTDNDAQTTSTDSSTDSKNSTTSKKKKPSNKSVKNSSSSDSTENPSTTDSKTIGNILSNFISLTSLLMIIFLI
ncbi:transmembrane protein, putative (macronuclear) [Tetrahymena thermophila SB210]|uniref:Transmembrane protein, putative n=1 Tax=Tetrahymena thermophila (strain SB210) TaxID=312017 RepID=Q22T26_TETTS|nr:transmembrane protein, putative [Tetrahymena thermophila SB210]EAR88612.1 transmembrane protein, putative [Tetrahymena thermophila SB210]|eukprot:XP_001008857.1 transmembrane protein, putative [Tetrahymena thermophila SB210]